MISGTWKPFMGVRQMLFSEIYGSYFNVVAAVLSEAAENTLTTGKLTAIVQEKAFAESVLSIPAALQSGAWPLLDSGYHTVLRGKPTMPLTTLQKRWLKALLSDPRIALFYTASISHIDLVIRSRHERSRRRGTVIYPGYLRPV